MRPGGAGRLHLELVFFIKTLTQIQPSLLIKAPVSKNVYIRYQLMMIHEASAQRVATVMWCGLDHNIPGKYLAEVIYMEQKVMHSQCARENTTIPFEQARDKRAVSKRFAIRMLKALPI
jgi:hypothetical protein